MSTTAVPSRRTRSLGRRLRPGALLVAALAALVSGCDDDPVAAEGEGAIFVIDVVGETFRVKVETAQQIAALEQRRASGRPGVLTGALRAGDGGFNSGWSWHLDPPSVEPVDLSIELCDGRPSFVQADLAYWIGTVKAYCPWSARVVARER